MSSNTSQQQQQQQQNDRPNAPSPTVKNSSIADRQTIEEMSHRATKLSVEGKIDEALKIMEGFD